MRPGVNVTSSRAGADPSAPSDTGVSFIVGLAERGPINVPVLCRSRGEFEFWFGNRISEGYLYDAAEFIFGLGGGACQFVRVAGPDAVVDTKTLNDGSGGVLRVDSIGPWDSGLKVQIIAGPTNAAKRVLVVMTTGNVELERSPEFADNDVAVAWGTKSKWVRVTKLGAALPIVFGPTALLTGDADHGDVTDTEKIAGIEACTYGYGPGQILCPGSTTAAIHAALLEQAKSANKFALLDATNTATVATILAQVTSIRAAVTAEETSHGILLAPWATTPGVTKLTTRTTPYSIIQAGLISRLDGRTGNPNILAAGSEAEAVTASNKAIVLALTQEYTDAQLETLNAGGVVVAKMLYGACRTYGGRTLADETDDDYDGYKDASAARLRMAIVNQAMTGGEEFLFDQIDGQGQKISEWNAYLAGILEGWRTVGALYGATAKEAYTVDTGPSVNTPTTISDNQLNAALSIVPSPFAEQVNIDISRRSIPSAV